MVIVERERDLCIWQIMGENANSPLSECVFVDVRTTYYVLEYYELHVCVFMWLMLKDDAVLFNIICYNPDIRSCLSSL